MVKLGVVDSGNVMVWFGLAKFSDGIVKWSGIK